MRPPDIRERDACERVSGYVPLKDLYRVVRPGDIDMTLRPDRHGAISELQRHFPHEKEGICRHFDLLYALFWR